MFSNFAHLEKVVLLHINVSLFLLIWVAMYYLYSHIRLKHKED